MKVLYLATDFMSQTSGISKKTISQCNALRNNGVETYFCHIKNINGYFYYVVNDNPIVKLGKAGFLYSISYRCKFSKIYKYIRDNDIDVLYVRYVHIGNPLLTFFFQELRKIGVKIILEIPTYPYDHEYNNSPLKKKIWMLIEKMSRKSFMKYVDRVVTVQDYDFIFNIPTIKISNGIDLKSIPLRTPKTHNGIVFIGVATLKAWHGFDRMIEGIGKYYENGGQDDIHFYIIGSKAMVEKEYLDIAHKYAIEEHIHMVGAKEGVELDYYFDRADMAIGSLGFHRIGLVEGKPLKCMEYAARGIPFMYSNINIDFDDKNYVIHVPADDSPICIEEIIKILGNINHNPSIIRNSISEKATWDYQMSIVYNEIKEMLQ